MASANVVQHVGIVANGDVKFLFNPTNSPEISETFTLEDAEILINKHVFEFATFELNRDGISCEHAARIGCTDSIYVKAEYNFCSQSAPWIIKKIWLSDGSNREKKGCYYANTTTNS